MPQTEDIRCSKCRGPITDKKYYLAHRDERIAAVKDRAAKKLDFDIEVMLLSRTVEIGDISKLAASIGETVKNNKFR
jgi:hypothetical protein